MNPLTAPQARLNSSPWALALLQMASACFLLLSSGCDTRSFVTTGDAAGTGGEPRAVSATQEGEASGPALGGLSRQFTTTIGEPPPLRRVMAGGPGSLHGGTTVQCSTCHSIRTSNLQNARTEQLDEFHQGLNMAHRNLTCASCHNAADNYASLKLADGKKIDFADSMQLCAQCHGPQYRDYQNGAHGGMIGFWDLSRGPRYRNHCQHCHDPHAPAFPQFTPVPGPKDRFPPLGAHGASAPGHDSESPNHE